MATAASISKGNLSKTLITDEKFPLSERSLHLSLEIGETKSLACLLDKHDNTYIALDTLNYGTKKNDKEAILKSEIFTAKAASISVVFTANHALLIPTPFFKKELVKEYLKAQQMDKENEVPCFDHIKNLDSFNLYTVNKDILAQMQNAYPNAAFRHTSSIFIEFVLLENKHIEDSRVFVSVFPTFIDVIVIKQGKLTLYNRFNYSNTADFIYYLLWVYEQMGLDAEKATCTFYGEIEKNSEEYISAGKYIKKISLGEKNKQSAYSNALNTLPEHKYRSLFTQYLCV